jgi:hypothetical protein
VDLAHVALADGAEQPKPVRHDIRVRWHSFLLAGGLDRFSIPQSPRRAMAAYTSGDRYGK